MNAMKTIIASGANIVTIIILNARVFRVRAAKYKTASALSTNAARILTAKTGRHARTIFVLALSSALTANKIRESLQLIAAARVNCHAGLMQLISARLMLQEDSSGTASKA